MARVRLPERCIISKLHRHFLYVRFIRQAVFLVMEESVNFLSMQQLRPSIVVLLIKVFDTLRHEKCFHAFLTSCPKSDFRADLSSFVRLSHSFLFTHPSVEVTSLSHPQHEALLPVWGRIVAIIFRDALQEDNPELLHYCRHVIVTGTLLF